MPNWTVRGQPAGIGGSDDALTVVLVVLVLVVLVLVVLVLVLVVVVGMVVVVVVVLGLVVVVVEPSVNRAAPPFQWRKAPQPGPNIPISTV